MTGFRFFPELVVVEITKFFQGELREGLPTSWGIRWGNGVCMHWFVTVNVGEKVYTPDMCFLDRKEAEEYCQRMGAMFPEACKALLGIGTHQFSSN